MLSEEFYNELKESQYQKDHFYISTLSAWLIYNDLSIFDKLLSEFEDKEEYLACAGISEAIDKIEEVHDNRFEEAAEEIGLDVDTEGFYSFTAEKHREVSKLIFEDIVREIYDGQIKLHKRTDREEGGISA